MVLPDFLQAGTNSHKLIGNWNFFRVGVVKNGCDHSGHVTLKLTVSEE